mgnify:CR=1 FL=1
MSEVTIIGLGLAKRVFQLHGAYKDGTLTSRKKLSRGWLLAFVAHRCRREGTSSIPYRMLDFHSDGNRRSAVAPVSPGSVEPLSGRVSDARADDAAPEGARFPPALPPRDKAAPDRRSAATATDGG